MYFGASCNESTYKLKTSDTCYVDGEKWDKIATASECGLAAAALGLDDATASTESVSNYPPGCYSLNGFLFFNTENPNYACSNTNKCLCKQSECPQDCNGRGTCESNGMCNCHDGYYGASCVACATIANAATVQCTTASDETITTCDPGYYGNPGDPSCQTCGAGSITNTGPNAGATTCTACTPGLYSLLSNVAACQTCAVGKGSSAGAATCVVFQPADSAALNAAIGTCTNSGYPNYVFSGCTGGCLGETSDGSCPTFAALHGVMGYWDVSQVTSLLNSTSTPLVSVVLSFHLNSTYPHCFLFLDFIFGLSTTGHPPTAFYDAREFNADISNWNTAVVTTMEGTFYSAFAFNQDISNWNTAAVTTMEGTFQSASVFNADLSKWDTAVVTNMERSTSTPPSCFCCWFCHLNSVHSLPLLLFFTFSRF